MESSLVSWQVENFSSAELFSSHSPPVSPAAPPSPSLYNGVPSLSPFGIHKSYAFNIGLGEKTISIPQSQSTMEISSSNSSRAQLASNILKDLELTTDFNDFGTNYDEASINLGLFEELQEIEYTPPSSPAKTKPAISETQSHHKLTEYSNFVTAANLPVQLQAFGQSSADISALTAEFQAILDSLPKDNTDVFSQVLEIAGIPTTVIDGEALVPIELDLTSMEMEIDEMNEDDVIEESELYGLSDQGSPASSVYSSYELTAADSVIDHHSDTAQKILDALLQGDVATAEAFLPAIDDGSDYEDESSMSSAEEDSISLSYVEEISTPSPLPITGKSSAVVVVKKPERRGRKPAKRLQKGSVAYVKDKTLRKKEQNKTAATRYRQKKKMEFSLISETESQLQEHQDDLAKKRDDLHKQIQMVRQLLREVINARKPSVVVKGKSIVSVGGSIAVPTILARGSNRRSK